MKQNTEVIFKIIPHILKFKKFDCLLLYDVISSLYDEHNNRFGFTNVGANN